MLTSHKKARKQSKLSFFMGVFLILLAFALMAIRTLMPLLDTANAPIKTSVAKPALSLGFEAANKKTPRMAHKEMLKPASFKVDVPIQGFNPRIGPLSAPIRLIIFGNMSCSDCHKALVTARAFVKEHPIKTRVVAKFAANTPASDASIEAGLFAALAHGKQLFWDVFTQKALHTAGGSSAGAYLNALQKADVPLKEVRANLADNSEVYMRQLTTDLGDFKQLSTYGPSPKLPAIIINDTLVELPMGQDIGRALRQKLTALLP